MRNYIRYIVILVLIIAGGLLLISVVNKFTEPDKTKVDNSQTEQKENKPAVEVLEPTAGEDNQTEESTTEEQQTPASTSETENVATPDTGTSVDVPDTATGEKTKGSNKNIPILGKVGKHIIVITEER